jgi:tRNA(fMet)-specific endonuclease VapC
MKYLLDTNAVIAVLNEPQGSVAERLRGHAPAEIGVSAVVMYELYYGAFRSRRQERNLALVDSLRFEIIDFDLEDARHAGEIRAWLAGQGTPIGAYDIQIAGQARARDLILVTRNTREFHRVDHLKVENWHDVT